ncbi:MAG: hypothetical protein OEM58_12935 [Nitrospirota bacterium]|nr:hypothetical protein [Nitrospirota bacterium]
MASATHPLWALIRLGMLLVTMIIVLWLSASNFDYTEWRAIIAVFATSAGAEGVLARVTRTRGSLTLQDGQVVDSSSYYRGFKDAGGDS